MKFIFFCDNVCENYGEWKVSYNFLLYLNCNGIIMRLKCLTKSLYYTLLFIILLYLYYRYIYSNAKCVLYLIFFNLT